MAYTTTTLIQHQIDERELARLTYDGTGATPTIDSTVVDAAISDAEAWINAQLENRYSVPFDPAPDLIQKAATAIAVWTLRSRRSAGMDDETRDQYKHWTSLILRIAEGKAGLPGASEEEEMDADESYVSGNERKFSRETMESF